MLPPFAETAEMTLARAAAERRRPVLIHCTGQVTTEDASGDGGAHGLGGQALGLAAGADALWGKPMPSFTNGEMQRIVADLLSSRQKQYATLRGDEHEVWLSKEGGSKSVR